jgi:hypothetical protein
MGEELRTIGAAEGFSPGEPVKKSAVAGETGTDPFILLKI